MKADEAREIADRVPKPISREDLALAEIFRRIKLSASRGNRQIVVSTDYHLIAFVEDLTKLSEPLIALGYTVSVVPSLPSFRWRTHPIMEINVSWG